MPPASQRPIASRSPAEPPRSTSPSAAPTSSPGPVPAPATPVDVTASADGEYTINVTWSESLTGVTGIAVDNGCPAGDTGCGAGATLAQTVGPTTHAQFAVTPGTYQCFRVRAFNNAGSSAWSGYGCTSTPGLTVPGTQQWTDTGVTVSAGDEVGITAAGQVYVLSTIAEGPAGNALCIPDVTYPTTKLPFPAPSLTCWSLIARIGSGAPFEVGSSALVTAPSSGSLYLGVNNDDVSIGSGSWTARIKLGGLPPAA
jgi:hypothetical protein